MAKSEGTQRGMEESVTEKTEKSLPALSCYISHSHKHSDIPFLYKRERIKNKNAWALSLHGALAEQIIYNFTLACWFVLDHKELQSQNYPYRTESFRRRTTLQLPPKGKQKCKNCEKIKIKNQSPALSNFSYSVSLSLQHKRCGKFYPAYSNLVY